MSSDEDFDNLFEFDDEDDDGVSDATVSDLSSSDESDEEYSRLVLNFSL